MSHANYRPWLPGPAQSRIAGKDSVSYPAGRKNALPDQFQAKARLSHSLAGDDLAEGRVHFADYLMLGGAYQDNRIVPMEGLNVSGFLSAHRNHLLEEYIGTMPDGPRSVKMEDFERHLSDAHFCWIGGSGPNDPFYYRIPSNLVSS